MTSSILLPLVCLSHPLHYSFIQARHISLHFNALPSLPAGIAGATSLVWLSLNANKLKGLPDELCALTGLQRLSLHINQVCVYMCVYVLSMIIVRALCVNTVCVCACA